MNKIMHNLTALLLAIVIIFIPVYSVSANDDSVDKIESVKTSIEKSFENFKDALNNDKENYGLSKSESFSSAILGNGIPNYSISIDKDAGTKLSLNGYIFPIEIGDKAAGIVKVEKDTAGQWIIADVSSDLTFEQDIAETKTLLPKDSASKLVYDSSLQVFAFYSQDIAGDYLLPFRDGKALDLKKHQVKPVKEVTSTMLQRMNKVERNSPFVVAGGMVNNSPKSSNNLYSIYVVIGLFVVAMSAGMVIKRRKKKVIN